MYALFDHRKDEEILGDLKVEPVGEKLSRYKSNRLRHVTLVNNNMMPTIMLNYRADGRRRLGRPWKSLLDEAETGLSRPNFDIMMIMMMIMVMITYSQYSIGPYP